MTLRWFPGDGFEVGAGIRWGDARKRTLIVAVHLGRGSLLALVRFWL